MSNAYGSFYLKWISEIKRDYLGAKLSAAFKINEELLRFYYHLGEVITVRGYEAAYGSGFYKKLSFDIRKEIPDAKGFSPTNLHYMSAFYRRYTPLFGKILQAAGKLFAIQWGHHQAILNRSVSIENGFPNPRYNIHPKSVFNVY